MITDSRLIWVDSRIVWEKVPGGHISMIRTSRGHFEVACILDEDSEDATRAFDATVRRFASGAESAASWYVGLLMGLANGWHDLGRANGWHQSREAPGGMCGVDLPAGAFEEAQAETIKAPPSPRGWVYRVSDHELVREATDADLRAADRTSREHHGYPVFDADGERVYVCLPEPRHLDRERRAAELRTSIGEQFRMVRTGLGRLPVSDGISEAGLKELEGVEAWMRRLVEEMIYGGLQRQISEGYVLSDEEAGDVEL